MGTGFSSGRYNMEGQGVPHLRPMNISREGEIVLDEVKYVEPEIVPEERGWLQQGDVLFNNTNSAELVGKTAPVTEEAAWAFSNHMTRLRPPKGLSYMFLARQLHFLWMAGYFRYRSTQHVNQASVSQRKLSRSVPLVVPPHQEQLRIVAEVEKQYARLHDAAARMERAAERLEEYKRTVLLDAVAGRLLPSAEIADGQESGEPPQGDIRKKRYRIPPSLKNDDLPRLPEGWVWASMKDVGDIKLGRRRLPEYDQGPEELMRPYLRVANVYEDRIDTSDVRRMLFTPEEYEVYHLEYGDILLNEGQSLDLVGRPAMFRNEVPGACYQNSIIRFRAREGVLSSFALIVFRSYLHGGEFQRVAKWSTSIAHLGTRRFSRMPFPLPPLVVQEKVVAEVDRRLSIVQKQSLTVQAAREKLDRLRFNILRKAFSGQLVHQDPGEGRGTDLIAEIRTRRETTGRRRERREGTSTTSMEDKPMSDRKALFAILEEAGHALTPEDLFRRSGITEELIDDFFDELKEEVEAGRIEERRDDDEQNVYLMLKEEVSP